MNRNYDAITFILRRPGIANFADFIKFAIMLNKATFKDSIKVKGIRKDVFENNILSAFPDIAKIANI